MRIHAHTRAHARIYIYCIYTLHFAHGESLTVSLRAKRDKPNVRLGSPVEKCSGFKVRPIVLFREEVEVARNAHLRY